MFIGLIISFAVPWFINCYYLIYCYDLFISDKWLNCFICMFKPLILSVICITLICMIILCWAFVFLVSANRYFDSYMYDAVIHVLYYLSAYSMVSYHCVSSSYLIFFVISCLYLLLSFAGTLWYSLMNVFIWVPLVLMTY